VSYSDTIKCIVQVMPSKLKVPKKSSMDLKKSHTATTIGIILYIVIQILLPFSHNVTLVITAHQYALSTPSVYQCVADIFKN